MSTLAQPFLFSWEIVEKSSEILRLKRALDVLPDSELIEALRKERKGKRDDYPVEALWNSLIAGVVFGHESVAALIRELRRNAELREICGFDPLAGEAGVPRDWVYSRFLAKLFRHHKKIEAMFEAIVERLRVVLPGYGVDLAIDGKALPTHGRGDVDADWGVKTYRGINEDGRPYETVKKWFGYRLHLIVDANHELPVSYQVNKASEAESPKLMAMIENLKRDHPQLHQRVETLSADKGYDDGADKAALWDEHGVSPLIDTRDCFTHTPQGAMRPLDAQTHDTIYYGPTGEVWCKIDPFAASDADKYVPMQYMGFEEKRESLKFRCPAVAFGVECKNSEACKGSWRAKRGDYGRVVRVPLDTDRRLFFPAWRHSRTFKSAYKKRSSVERVNSRIDQVYGFERHFIRGLRKMRFRIDLAMIVMLSTAVAWIEAGKEENIRSLVKAA